jgi:hypothetical protein
VAFDLVGMINCQNVGDIDFADIPQSPVEVVLPGNISG